MRLEFVWMLLVVLQKFGTMRSKVKVTTRPNMIKKRKHSLWPWSWSMSLHFGFYAITGYIHECKTFITSINSIKTCFMKKRYKCWIKKLIAKLFRPVEQEVLLLQMNRATRYVSWNIMAVFWLSYWQEALLIQRNHASTLSVEIV